MKTYRNLLEQSLTPQNVRKCMLDAAEGKLKRREVLRAFEHFDKTYDIVTKCARAPNYFPREDNKHIVIDGTNHKERTIEKPMFAPEQILHHVIIEPFKEVLLSGLYEQVYGCLPATVKETEGGKYVVRKYGPHAAAQKIRKWVQVGRKIYAAELDIHHAYDSVDLEILMGKLRKVIKDEAWLSIAERFVRGRTHKEKGLVLGHYTSPWFFNFYLKDFDHFAAGQEGIQYLRFADNLFLVGANKRKVHRAVDRITIYLRDCLKLELNRSAQIYRFEYVDRNGKTRGRAVNALGFVVHHNRMTLRKRLLKEIRKKAMRIKRKREPTWHDAAAMLSRLAWIRCTDTYGYYMRHIKPNIQTKVMKKKVRAHSRAMQGVYKERRKIINDGLEKSKWLSANQTGRI